MATQGEIDTAVKQLKRELESPAMAAHMAQYKDAGHGISERVRGYKTPSRATMDRAEAHYTTASILKSWLAENRERNGAAFARVMQDEIDRQVRMVRQYQQRYGPNSHL